MTEASTRRPSTDIDLNPVREEQAAPDVKTVFTTITETLRVPFPGLFWRVLASDPPLFAAAWEAVAPNMSTFAFERAADQLRARALIPEAAEMPSHQAFKGDLVRAEIDYDLRDKINNFNHIAAYALAKHLLAVSLLESLLEGDHQAMEGDSTSIPTGLAAGAVPVSPLDPAMARGRAAELLPVVAAGHGHPQPEDYFRSLARLPDYLGAAWNALKPVVRDDEYDARREELVTMARAEAMKLPLGARLSVDQDQRSRLASLTALFGNSILPETLIDATIVTTLTDGPDLAGLCRYALTSQE